jgi:superoxide dismutase
VAIRGHTHTLRHTHTQKCEKYAAAIVEQQEKDDQSIDNDSLENRIKGRSRTKTTRFGQNTTQNTFAKLIFHSIECRNTEPKTYEEALASSFRHKWEEAITSELDSLDENKTINM